MGIEPVLAAPFIIKLHLAAALMATAAGVSQFLLGKGGGRHRLVGWIGVVALAIVAATSFWITELMKPYWSPIHILSIVTLGSLVVAIRAIRAGDVLTHRRAMIGVFAGLAGAALFTLVPGRLLNLALFGS